MSDTVSWVVQLRIDIFFKEVWDFSVIGSILIWNKQKTIITWRFFLVHYLDVRYLDKMG